jgi:rod shape-determining protein MreB
LFRLFSGFFGSDIGIDLGTVNVVVYVKGKGIVINEPSVIAVRKSIRGSRKEILAVGRQAKAMVGKTPAGIETVKPMREGVISDFDMTEAMISHFVRAADDRRGFFSRPRVVVSVPACVTEVERRAVVDATLSAGAREAYVVEEPLAAALGASLPIHEPRGNMVVDIGGGTCEVAVLSMGGIVVSKSIRGAGDEIDSAIVSMLRLNHKLAIGDATAEQIKWDLGSVAPLDEELRMEVKGRALTDGLPRSITLSSVQVREAIEPIIGKIEDTIRETLEATPPELVKDIYEQGLVLAGGGALLRGLSQRLSQALNVPVFVADDPLIAVSHGLAKVLEDLDAKRPIMNTVERGSL